MYLWLQAASKNNPDDNDALKAIDLLYDAALVSSGFTVSILGSNLFLTVRSCSYINWPTSSHFMLQTYYVLGPSVEIQGHENLLKTLAKCMEAFGL